MIRMSFTLALIVASCAAPARADPVADFYKGAVVSMVVSTSAGGGYDALARAIARHIGKHIPGAPTVVVRNMPGAGGIVAANYLYAAAPRDGSVLGLIQNDPPLEPLFGTSEAHFDPTKFNWLGTPSVETAMVLVWHTVPVNSVDDLRRRETAMGASGANSTPAFFARLLNATLHTKMKVIPGFPGQNDAFLAMERGELDGYPSVFYSALSSTRPTWLPEKKAKAIVQYGPEKLPELGDVPFAPDLVADPQDKQLLQLAFTPLALGRPLLLPPDVPAARVTALRQALMQTFADPDFLADAKKTGLQVNSPRSGDDLLRAIARAYHAPPQIIARLRQLNKP
jgi:tripartite-type tricarboxylate transporter receptor subunit TctC